MRRYYSGLLLSTCFLLLAIGWTGCDTNEPEAEVIIEDITTGTGQAAEAGMRLRVAYRGRLENDLIFDESDSFSFTLGDSRLIAGWNRGIEGMQVGGTRQITIPPELAYGSQGAGCTATSCTVPPNSTISFIIDLLDLCDPEVAESCF